MTLNDVLYLGLICAGVGSLLRLMYWAIEVEYGKPSEWCHRMWTECIERGDEESAGHYMELYNQWLSRGY